MKIHFITIFPESFDSYFSSSIIGRSIKDGCFEPVFHKLNDFSDKPQKRVDSKAYGMHGQVICPEILAKAIVSVKGGKDLKVVYMSPRGELLTQEKIENYLDILGEEFIIICGHYEGIDQRIIDLYVDFEISIGEYVISSGELSSMVFVDALVRHLPEVLGNKDSLDEDSFSKKFDRRKEHPIYTRPEVFEGLEVPKILLSGNHKEIEKWKKENLD